jgi:DNA-binding NtrC family response regulator
VTETIDNDTRPSLLIVDDDMGFVRAAAEIARGMSYDVTVAGGVEQARARLSRGAFDIALIDLSLPDGSGLDVVERCDAERTRIVLATGHPTLDSTLLALRPPAFDYLVKPIEPALYRRLLQETADQRGFLPAIAAQRTPPAQPLPDETDTSIRFSVGMSFEEIERRMLMKTLRQFDDDKTRTARVLGVSVKTIYNRLARYQQQDRATAEAAGKTDHAGGERSGERD